MSLGTILYTLLIGPLKTVFELIFAFSYKIVPNAGIDIMIMSLLFNLLVLPLYRRADQIQKETREKEDRLAPVIDHIKKSFSGDEKVMMLQTYYRINNYSPLSSLKSMISLLLQIPFFIAAYQFLSNLSLLEGQSLGPIADLMKPDSLISAGGITVNVLPLAMTAVNLISAEVMMKGQKFKAKIPLYISALVFLILLYNSPAGLVFYWTLNNVFALVKNIIVSLIPSSGKTKEKAAVKEKKTDTPVFITGMISLTLLTGFLIPSSVVSSSTADFVFVTEMNNPVSYVIHTFLMMAGLFIIWCGIYYYLSSRRMRTIFANISFALAVVSTFNYFLYGSDLGMVSAELVFGIKLTYETEILILSSLSAVLIMAAVMALYHFLPKISPYILITLSMALFAIGTYDTVKIYNDFGRIKATEVSTEAPRLKLDSEGRNVVVFMMDRAVGGMLPYIFNEHPELEEKYDGFTYYPNTLSFSDRTNIAAPALFGGYEYTPERINAREDELLKDKHNEALLVMPLLFSRNGYDTTVVDMPYVNYSVIKDTSLFRQYDSIDAYIAEDILNPYADEVNEQLDLTRNRNFPLYSMIMIAPPALHSVIYSDGSYNDLNPHRIGTANGYLHFPQSYEGISISDGVDPYYMNAVTVLESLPDLTEISEDGSCSFTIIDNNTTHEPMLLTEPDYSISDKVDNTAYDQMNMDRFTVNGRVMRMESYFQMCHYHANASALMKLAGWFDYLRENGCWDNTRIIIVADHGRALDNFEDMIIEDIQVDAETYNPLLLVKDFGSTGFSVSDEFMTNADVPSIAFDGLINDPVNPFTGNAINNELKFAGDQHVFFTEEWSIYENRGNRFNPGSWYSVHDNIFDRSNWRYLGEN